MLSSCLGIDRSGRREALDVDQEDIIKVGAFLDFSAGNLKKLLTAHMKICQGGWCDLSLLDLLHYLYTQVHHVEWCKL